MSSPNPEAMSLPSYFENEHGRPSRRPSVILPDILSGDEGDDENKPKQAKAQDFGIGSNSVSHSPERLKPKKMSKKAKKNKSKKYHSHHHHHQASEDVEAVATEPVAQTQPESMTLADITGPRVGFVDDTPVREGTPNSRKAGIKTFSRPTLPKLLSKNVFVDPPPAPLQPLSQTNSRSLGTPLRRTSSLPDRLNERARSTPGARQLPAGRTVIGRPLPPYAARGAWAARARPDVPVVSAADEEEDAPDMSRTAAVVMLLFTTALVAVCAEFLVDAIPQMTENSSVSQAFIGLIILPIVGNAAEHVTAVTVAAKNKMDLAIGVAVGSSIQIALFITPIVVILGWCMDKSMTLYFNLFETVSLFVTAFVVNFLVLDGKSNYLEGVLLIAAYIIIA
jgi:Ca2+:H+ antiporter